MGSRSRDFEAKNNEGQSALHYAVTEYQIPMIEFLLQKGAKSEEKDISGYNSMHFAVLRIHKAIVEILIKHGTDLEAKYGSLSFTPLHITTLSGHAEIAQLLITNGARIDAKDSYGQRPLHWATLGVESKTLKVLL